MGSTQGLYSVLYGVHTGSVQCFVWGPHRVSTGLQCILYGVCTGSVQCPHCVLYKVHTGSVQCFVWDLHRVSTVSTVYFVWGLHRVCTVFCTVSALCFVWGPHKVCTGSALCFVQFFFSLNLLKLKMQNQVFPCLTFYKHIHCNTEKEKNTNTLIVEN